MQKALLISLAAVAATFAGMTVRDTVSAAFANKITPTIAAAQNIDVKQCRTTSGEACTIMNAR